MTPAKINFKVYQGATFEQALRWESETKTYLPITAITKSAPVTITVADTTKLPPIGWRVHITNVSGMKEINMPEGVYEVVSPASIDTIVLNSINSLAYSTYTGGGVVEYNTPVSFAAYSAKMQIRKKLKDPETLLELSTANGGILINDTLKTLTIKATPEQTRLLDFSQAVYDLELTNSAGEVYRFAEGTILLKAEVTR